MPRPVAWAHVALLVLVAALSPRLYRGWLANSGRVLAVRSYLAPLEMGTRVTLITAAQRRLAASGARPCCYEGVAAGGPGAVTELDACLAGCDAALFVLTDRTELPADRLTLGGASKVNRVNGDLISMFSNGYAEARVFLLSEEEQRCRLSLAASGSGPPPVTLTVMLDGDPVAERHYAPQDGWQEITFLFSMPAGFHTLWVAFTNDFVDRASGADRNAYVRDMIIRLE